MSSPTVITQAGSARASVRLPYLPALDGLRGVALIAILLTHGGVERVRGGHLALTVFFTLSGFLITALLLVERHRTGGVDLRMFWARRARRLVPALLLTFPLVAATLLLAESPPRGAVVLDAIAAATWMANWRFVLSGQGYADLFTLPSPFQHFWSLAVEEQFYLVFPLVLLVVLGVGSARARTGRLALLLGLLVVASTLQLARLHADDGVLGRAYYGTDARLAEILVGSLLALAMVGPQGLRPLSRPVRGGISAAGVAGLLGLGWLVLTLEQDDPFAYRGGFLLAALCSAAVVASSVLPDSPATRLLSLRPLVWLGLISYGVYLFHWPIFLLLTEPYTGLGTMSLLALRLSSVILLAWLSLVLLERPVRSGTLPALHALVSWATGTTAGLVLVVAVSATFTLAPAPVLAQQASNGSVAAGAEVEPEALRVAVVGDSLAGDLGEGLERWSAGRTDVVALSFAVGGCPISRGGDRRVIPDRHFPILEECSWWGRDSSRKREFESFAPHLVLVEAGIDEVFERKLPEWGDWRTPGHPELDRWMAGEYQSAVRAFAAQGAKVLLLNTPCADWGRVESFRELKDTGNVRAQQVNVGIYNRVTDVQMVDLMGRICPGGQYRDDVEGVQGGRFDGFHFTEPAADALARNWLGPLVLEAGAGR